MLSPRIMIRACAAIVLLLALLLPACGRMPDFNRDVLHREPSISEDPSQPLRITAIDVGEGDATLIEATSGEAMLIDAGPPGAGQEIVLPLLSSAGISRLAAIVVTHYHEDHIGGVPEVIAGPDGAVGTDDDLVQTGAIYDRGDPERDPESPSFPLYVAAAACCRTPLHPGDHLRLGDLDLEVVAAGGVLSDGTEIGLGDPPDENAASIALLISSSNFRMLIEGDATGGGGEPPYQTPDVETALGAIVGDIDVLRVAHHGSNTSTNAALLAATRPEAAIISVGDGNDYHHPHRSVIERLVNTGIAVYQTERGGLDADGPIVAGGNVVVEVDNGGAWQIIME